MRVDDLHPLLEQRRSAISRAQRWGRVCDEARGLLVANGLSAAERHRRDAADEISSIELVLEALGYNDLERGERYQRSYRVEGAAPGRSRTAREKTSPRRLPFSRPRGKTSPRQLPFSRQPPARPLLGKRRGGDACNPRPMESL